VWLDISAFTPVEISSDGVPVWSGRVKETPSRQDADGSTMTVQCEGWQYHLDDDLYDRVYVSNNLTGWQDQRSFVDADLARFLAAGNVQAGDGAITLMYANGATLTNPTRAGVTLDLGEDSTAKRIVLTYASSNNAGLLTLRLRSTPTADAGGATYDEAVTVLNNAGASGTLRGSFSTGYRFVHVFGDFATAGVLGFDCWFKLSSILVASATAYESSDASVLKASDVVSDALAKATLLLDADRSLIEASSFSLPEFATGGYATPREAMQRVNAYDDKLCGVDVYRRPYFRARLAYPLIETWGAFEDSSANSGQEIYNRVIVEAAGVDGAPVIVRVMSEKTLLASAIQLSNPGWEVNTTGWTGTTRSVIGQRTGAGCGQVGYAASGVSSSWTGSIVSGQHYVLELYLKEDTSAPPAFSTDFSVTASVTSGGGVAGSARLSAITGSYQMLRVPFVARDAAPILTITTRRAVYVDDLYLWDVADTLPDRRGFQRTKILTPGSVQTTATATQLGDLWLARHVTTPLRGTVTITGGGDTRTVIGGRVVTPAEMLLHVGEPLRLARTREPDTGASHRDGVIAAASWNPETNTASVALDSERNNFDSLLARLAIITGTR